MLGEQSSYDLISDSLFADVRLADLLIMTSLAKEEIEAMLPSELAVVVEGCKAANPDFFGMLARLSKAHAQA